MATYPTTPIPAYGSTRGARKVAIRTESEAGYGRTRSRFTRDRKIFVLEYKTISGSQYDTLEAFFLANQGSIFDFYYPDDLTNYRCMFNQDEIIKKEVSFDICDTTIQLITV